MIGEQAFAISVTGDHGSQIDVSATAGSSSPLDKAYDAGRRTAKCIDRAKDCDEWAAIELRRGCDGTAEV